MKNKPLVRVILATLLLISTGAHSSNVLNTNEATRAIIDRQSSALLATFKRLHQNPELGFQEFETSRLVAEKLENLGYRVTTGIAETGVVGVLENGPGPVVLFRSDMDALPLEELVDISYKSTKQAKNLAGETVPDDVDQLHVEQVAFCHGG